MHDKHLTWDGKREINVTFSLTGPPRERGGRNTIEANVKRTFRPSDGLHDAIFNLETGAFSTKNAAEMTLHQRSTWLHLWDGVCCESISAMEAYDCIRQGRVSVNLLTRASNYMHLV